jgi:Ricin-type beta-trefoil lectin domain
MKMSRLGYGAGILAIITTLLVGVSPAHAVGINRFVNHGFDHCLWGTYEGGPTGVVAPRVCSGSTEERWVWFGVTGQWTPLRNLGTDRCLDSNTQGAVYTLPCNESNRNQAWFIYRTADGQPFFLRNLATDMCLAESRARVIYARNCNPVGNDELWRIHP